MVFSSIIFLVWFLPIFLFLYHLAHRRYRNLLILLGSVFFYAWGAPKFIFVFFGTSLLDFHLVRWMHQARVLRLKRLLLILSLSLNLGLLAFFKYSNFFVENVNALLHGIGNHGIPWVEVALPLGISFFIFESLTYVIDVYRGVHAPLRNFWDYQMYILLFPKLIAGPIVRYHEIAHQITGRRESSELILTGFYRFVMGLGKKVFIANKVGAAVAPYFAANPDELSAGQAWIGLIGFTMQIYFDFSGYSDMALGLARMLGFRLPENFHNPFISKTITEFWRRWHITLGNWMRNYLYIPLGGNRTRKPWQGYRNLAIVFLASGFWHGASWNFVIWGAFHGFWLILDRLFLLRLLEHLGRVPSMLWTGFWVMIGFGIFKIESLDVAIRYYTALFSARSGIPYLPKLEFWVLLVLALAFSWFAAVPALQRLQDRVFAEQQSTAGHLAMFVLSAAMFIFALSFIAWQPYNPFLYFRF